MLVLLDEMLPSRLARAIVGHDVRTVRQMGWESNRNGELLRLATTAGFGALITADRNIEYQQNLSLAGVGIVVVIAPNTGPEHVLPLAPRIVEALTALRPGEVAHVPAP